MADNFNILDTPSGGGGVFSESFESAEQTITTNGTLSIAHGLSAKPPLLQAVIICKTAEAGYAVGNELVINNGFGPLGSDDSSRNINMFADATNIEIKYANSAQVFAVMNKVSGNFGTLSNGNWRLIVRAWA